MIIHKKIKSWLLILLIPPLVGLIGCNRNNDHLCICYVYTNGVQTGIEELGDLIDRNECEKKSYFISNDNYSSCQTASAGSQVPNRN